MAQRPIVTLTTDFGLNDHFVGTIKGVILGIVPDAELVDICHTVQAFDILDGALALAHAYSYFPSGTVHLVIVYGSCMSLGLDSLHPRFSPAVVFAALAVVLAITASIVNWRAKNLLRRAAPRMMPAR